MLSLLLFSGLAFFVLLPMLQRTETITLDFDWIWRRFIPHFWRDVLLPLLQGLDRAQKAVLEWLPSSASDDGNLPAQVRRRLPGNWAVSVPVFVIVLMLLTYLVVYFWLLP